MIKYEKQENTKINLQIIKQYSGSVEHGIFSNK